MICPNCGEKMYFIALTDAHFKPVPDDNGGFRIGSVILDEDSIDCINESIREEELGNVEFKCPYCFSSFSAEQDPDTGTYYIGDEI